MRREFNGRLFSKAGLALEHVVPMPRGDPLGELAIRGLCRGAMLSEMELVGKPVRMTAFRRILAGASLKEPHERAVSMARTSASNWFDERDRSALAEVAHTVHVGGVPARVGDSLFERTASPITRPIGPPYRFKACSSITPLRAVQSAGKSLALVSFSAWRPQAPLRRSFERSLRRYESHRAQIWDGRASGRGCCPLRR